MAPHEPLLATTLPIAKDFCLHSDEDDLKPGTLGNQKAHCSGNIWIGAEHREIKIPINPEAQFYLNC
jgi:hypothetical protein